MPTDLDGVILNSYDLPALELEILRDQIEGRSHWVALCLDSGEHNGNVREGELYPLRVSQVGITFSGFDGQTAGAGLVLEGDIEELLLDVDSGLSDFAAIRHPDVAKAVNTETLNEQHEAYRMDGLDLLLWSGQTSVVTLCPMIINRILLRALEAGLSTTDTLHRPYAVINLPRYRSNPRAIMHMSSETLLLAAPDMEDLAESNESPCLVIPTDSVVLLGGFVIYFENKNLAEQHCLYAHELGLRSEAVGPSLDDFKQVLLNDAELEDPGENAMCNNDDDEDEDFDYLSALQEEQLSSLTDEFLRHQPPFKPRQLVSFKQGLCPFFDIDPEAPAIVMEVLDPPAPNTLPQSHPSACERWDTIAGLLDEDDLVRRYVDSRRLCPREGGS